ncbi:MAG: hypothetical protein ACRDMU_04030 [Gaiellaceae bacterium]
MRRLRSRWTVVALVPACFLASFGLVTALAGGSDDPAPQVAGADADRSGEGAAPLSTVAGATTTAEDGGPGTGTASTITDAGESGATTSADNRGAAPAPPAGTIAVDYGRWEGVFEISEAEIVPGFGIATVAGQFRYLGGGECSQVGAVELSGQFYNPSGQPIGKGAWESIWVTGEGAEVPQREPLFLEFYGEVAEAPESARIRFTRVDCL